MRCRLQAREAEGSGCPDRVRAVGVVAELPSPFELQASPVTPCGDIISSEEGRRTASRCIFNRTIVSWPDSLNTPTTITVTIGDLGELQCPNTTEAVMLWAWDFGVISPLEHDNDTWALIWHGTLRFYNNLPRSGFFVPTR